MILAGKELSLEIQKNLKTQAAKLGTDKYVAIIFLGDDYSSATYVNHKQKYWEAIWIPVAIFGQYKKTDLPSNQEDKFNDISIYIKQNYDTIFKIME